MPIHKTKSGGWKWGKSGKVYKTRAGAERQMKENTKTWLAIVSHFYKGC